MIGRMKPMLCLIMLAMAVCAAGSDQCRSTLTTADVATALGQKVRIQQVFSNGEMRGWRVYGTQWHPGERSFQEQGQRLLRGRNLARIPGPH